MKTLRKKILRAVRSGSYKYATVEGVGCGLITVRVSSGARLTNLFMIGTAEIGDTVIVDYASGRPYARAINITSTEDTEAVPFAGKPLEEEVS